MPYRIGAGDLEGEDTSDRKWVELINPGQSPHLVLYGVG